LPQFSGGTNDKNVTLHSSFFRAAKLEVTAMTTMVQQQYPGMIATNVK